MTTQLTHYAHNGLQVTHTAKDLLHLLIKQGVEAILNAELQEHLDVERTQQTSAIFRNSRNGTLKKRVLTSLGPIAIRVPRDRKGTFKPRIVTAYKKDITDKDQSLIALYEEGLTQNVLEASSKELYNDPRYKPSHSLIARIGSLFRRWQQRIYDPLYITVSCDLLLYQAPSEESTVKKGYICSGTTSTGSMHSLGLWTITPQDENFWKTFFTSLKAKGVTDIWVVYRKELPSFKDLLATIFQRTPFQQYVVSLIYEALPSIPRKLHIPFLLNMKVLYKATTTLEIRSAFTQLSTAWGPSSPFDTTTWLQRWEDTGPFVQAS